MTAHREGRSPQAGAAPPSNVARAVGLAATAGAVFIAVYALGSARGWWEGSSCALASCGADDIEWAWYGVAVVATVAAVLLAMSTRQLFRDDESSRDDGASTLDDR